MTLPLKTYYVSDIPLSHYRGLDTIEVESRRSL